MKDFIKALCHVYLISIVIGALTAYVMVSAILDLYARVAVGI